MPVRMAVIKKVSNNQSWGGCGDRETSCMLVRIGVGTATMETAWGFLRKLEVELPYDPAVPLPGIYPKTMKTLIQKDIYSPI